MSAADEVLSVVRAVERARAVLEPLRKAYQDPEHWDREWFAEIARRHQMPVQTERRVDGK